MGTSRRTAWPSASERCKFRYLFFFMDIFWDNVDLFYGFDCIGRTLGMDSWYEVREGSRMTD